MKTDNELRALHGKGYVEKFESNQSHVRLDRLLPYMHLGRDDDVVDYACGNAMLMPHLVQLVNTYTGVDFSKEFIDAAELRKDELKIGNANFYCGDIEEFCRSRQQTFDAAFAMDFSEHVYDESWCEILTSIRYSLKESGKFYMHTPNAEYIIELLKDIDVLKQLPEHIAVRNAENNVKLLKRSGFSNIKVYSLSHYEKRQEWVHHLRHLPFIGMYFRARLFISCTA